mmetsp:Transcript_12458/g.32000  ORF Transcript_12458/g.32000 Transcript_12458/m.32000 type:complete len:292 (-) Transcript_12458:56-931(-)
MSGLAVGARTAPGALRPAAGMMGVAGVAGSVWPRILVAAGYGISGRFKDEPRTTGSSFVALACMMTLTLFRQLPLHDDEAPMGKGTVLRRLPHGRPPASLLSALGAPVAAGLPLPRPQGCALAGEASAEAVVASAGAVEPSLSCAACGFTAAMTVARVVPKTSPSRSERSSMYAMWGTKYGGRPARGLTDGVSSSVSGQRQSGGLVSSSASSDSASVSCSSAQQAYLAGTWGTGTGGSSPACSQAWRRRWGAYSPKLLSRGSVSLGPTLMCIMGRPTGGGLASQPRIAAGG